MAISKDISAPSMQPAVSINKPKNNSVASTAKPAPAPLAAPPPQDAVRISTGSVKETRAAASTMKTEEAESLAKRVGDQLSSTDTSMISEPSKEAAIDLLKM